MPIRRLVIALALLALAACTVQFGTPGSSSQTASSLPQQERVSGEQQSPGPTISGSGSMLEERLLANGMLEIGNALSAHSVVLFTNYGCDYCRKFEAERMPLLLAEAAKGTLRIAIAPLDLKKYPDSDETARLLLCAAQQNKGSVMHAFLFAKPSNPALMQKQIGIMGLNAQALAACLQSPELTTIRAVQQSAAHALNVTLVPTYFIDGMSYVGLPEEAELQSQLEQAFTR